MEADILQIYFLIVNLQNILQIRTVVETGEVTVERNNIGEKDAAVIPWDWRHLST